MRASMENSAVRLTTADEPPAIAWLGVQRLETAGSGPVYRRLVYAAVLWAGAACGWWISLGLLRDPSGLP